MALNFNKVAVNMEVKVPHQSIERHTPASPQVIGNEVAKQVHEYAMENKLGYYPALEYFNAQGGIDSDLINAVESLSWVAAQIVCNEVKTILRPIFTGISIESVHNQAFTLPKVKMAQWCLPPRLVEHFTPDVIKLNMITTLIKKHSRDEKACMEKTAAGLIYRWLANRFDRLDVTGVKSI